MREFSAGRAKVEHPYAWLWEPLEEQETFALRSMFGAKAAYLDGRMIACFCARAEPWRGMLVCAEREQHAPLMSEFPELSPHPILGKWLYLPESDAGFERVAAKVIRLALRRDPRIGIVPPPKKKKSAAAKKRTGAR